MHYIPAYITLFFVSGIVFPYLPILVRNLGYPAATVGILLSIAEGAGILGPFIFGRVADKYGKYKGCIALSYVLAAAAAVPLALFVHPVLSGIFIAVSAIGFRSSMPLLDSITTIHLGEKGNYGKIRVFGSIAFVCFVFFMQWVPVLRPNTSVNIAFWICVTAALGIIVITLLPSKYTTRMTPSKDTGHAEAGKKSIWTPIFIVGLVSIALNRMAMVPVHSFFSLFLVEYMRWDAVGLMMTLSGLAEIPFIFFSYRLIRRYGTMPILAFTSAIVALRLGLYAIFPFKAGVIAGQLLHSFCFGLFHPASIAFISDSVPSEQRSYGMTLYLSLGWGLPAFLGNFMGGFVIDNAGFRSLFGYFTVFALLSAAIYPVYYLRNRYARNKQKASTS